MAIRTFILGILEDPSNTAFKTYFVSNEGKKLTGDPKDLLVAASDELGSVSRFISRRCKDRREFFEKGPEGMENEDRELYDAVHRIFRSPVDMKPIRDENGAVSCYVDKDGKIHDVAYIKETFEELPLGAFKMKQRVFTFIGKTNSTKTTMIEELSVFMMGLINENPDVHIEIANRPGSPVFSVYADICARFDQNRMPDRSHAGVEIQETSYNVTYGHLQKIAGGEPLVFACAAAGGEPVKNEETGCFEYPEGFVPFNLDEPLLYLMNREGLYPAHEDEELSGERTGGPLWKVLESLVREEYGDDYDDDIAQ